jgi:hypothetical protein
LAGVGEATRLVPQQVCEAAPRLGGCSQAAALCIDPLGLPIVALGLIPSLLLVVDLAELVPCSRFHLGLVELLKQPPRRVLAPQRLLQRSFGQGECAQTGQLDALAAKIVQLLGNLEGRSVGFSRLAVLAPGAERIAKLRAQRAPQALHPIARREPADDRHRIPHIAHRKVGPPPEVKASTQPPENHRPFVARRIAESREDGFENLPRLFDPTVVQQLLAAHSFTDVPRLTHRFF